MELITLLLMGVAYTLLSNGVSQLIVYFLIQSLSSFAILVSYIVGSVVLLTLAFFLKLGMFPFLRWYLGTVSHFPNFLFWLVGTFHKLPPLVLLLSFNLILSPSLFWVSVLFTTLIRASLILSTIDLRLLLVSSSVGNNS